MERDTTQWDGRERAPGEPPAVRPPSPRLGEPLINIEKLRREFPAGDETIAVLKDIDLKIWPGEMVAIIGQSGSGKSTLMNVLGCLDNGWTGAYRFGGQDVKGLPPDRLAELRREHFGFIFQRYQLLSDLDAVENVEVPAIYAGAARTARRGRARSILDRLGLSDRLTHRPAALSGGQQQRVSVARALMNGGEVILADEPTGALDSKSGVELMGLLKELHDEGHAIIIVTHDPRIAEQCERVVEIADGVIISDTRRPGARSAARAPEVKLKRVAAWRTGLDRFGEALSMALRAMSSHKLRTFLTMLGIIIGIASVVSVVALGQGSQEQVLENISAIGTNTINVFPGSGFGGPQGRIRTLVPSDAEALAAQSFVAGVSPRVSSNAQARYRNVAANVSISGVGAQYFAVSGTDLTDGVAFTEDGVAQRSQEAVIDANAQAELFPDGEDPIGKVIILGRQVPVRIIGVAEASSGGFGPSNSLNVWIPYTTAMTRVLGISYLQSITVQVAETADIDDAEARISALLAQRHGTTDFTLQNTDTIRSTIESTTQTLTLLISMIAVISLLVGGIGVMNIMLVSVSERTKEIGVRMAVGARRGDILRQFLIEAVLVCLVGGAVGVGLSYALGWGLSEFTPARLSYSATTIIAAFVSSTLIGVVFGFMPARSAARLDPVEALARE
jgi:macrolide transport system ATP-binding/permease protein